MQSRGLLLSQLYRFGVVQKNISCWFVFLLAKLGCGMAFPFPAGSKYSLLESILIKKAIRSAWTEWLFKKICVSVLVNRLK